MFLSNINIALIVYLFLFCTIENCYSHRRANARTTRMRRPDYFDYDYIDEEMQMTMRRPKKMQARGQIGVNTIVQTRYCPNNSFFNKFYVLWEYTPNWPFASTKQPAVYGINVICEDYQEMRVIGTYRWASGRTDQFSTGRVHTIEYWTVNNKIYKFQMCGTWRCGQYETVDWQPGIRIKTTLKCPDDQYMYGLSAQYVGTTDKADFMYKLDSPPICRLRWQTV